MKRRSISAEDHARIAAAIRQAEARTAGEIYCVLAQESDRYFAPAALAALCGVLAMSLVASLVLDALWLEARPTLFVAAQVLAAVIALLVLKAWPALRRHFVPAPLRHARAHDNAVRQFLAHHVHRTEARTGVLLFVSVAERYAEVLADSGISERVPQEAWNDTVALLTRHAADGRLADGFVEAIGKVGLILAEHAPLRPGDRNELDDHLIEL